MGKNRDNSILAFAQTHWAWLRRRDPEAWDQCVAVAVWFRSGRLLDTLLYDLALACGLRKTRGAGWVHESALVLKRSRGRRFSAGAGQLCWCGGCRRCRDRLRCARVRHLGVEHASPNATQVKFDDRVMLTWRTMRVAAGIGGPGPVTSSWGEIL